MTTVPLRCEGCGEIVGTSEVDPEAKFETNEMIIKVSLDYAKHKSDCPLNEAFSRLPAVSIAQDKYQGEDLQFKNVFDYSEEAENHEQRR